MDAVDLDRFAAAAGGHSPDLASRDAVLNAATAVLAELGEYVSGAGARRLAAALPEEMAAAVHSASAEPRGGDSATFYAGVARREGTEPDVAAAHVQAIFRAIVETVEEEAVVAVRDQLTPELSALLAEEREGDTSELAASGPVEPDAPKQAGFERPVHPRS